MIGFKILTFQSISSVHIDDSYQGESGEFVTQWFLHIV